MDVASAKHLCQSLRENCKGDVAVASMKQKVKLPRDHINSASFKVFPIIFLRDSLKARRNEALIQAVLPDIKLYLCRGPCFQLKSSAVSKQLLRKEVNKTFLFCLADIANM